MNFDVFRPRGRNWQHIGTYDERNSRNAALKASYIHRIKVVGVRPADCHSVKLIKHRFRKIAVRFEELHLEPQ